MALELSFGKSSKKNVLRGKLPYKRSINLVTVNEKKINIPKAVVGILLIIGLAGTFSKVLVFDRLLDMNRVAGDVAQKRAELDQYNALLKNYDGIEDNYAHYTYAGMTNEEMSLVSRTKVMSLVGKVFVVEDKSVTWSLTENILTVETTRDTLDELNDLARKLEKSAYVNNCIITTANKKQNTNTVTVQGKKKTKVKVVVEEKVTGKFTVYLQQLPEKEEEGEQP